MRSRSTSATRTWPEESAARLWAWMICPVSALVPPTISMNVPDGVNLRTLKASETQTLPLASIAIPLGAARLLFPIPKLPHLARNWPWGENFWTRWLPRSATQTLPAASRASALGSWSWPSADPGPPNLARNWPLGLNFSTRLLPLSSTQRFPWSSATASAGLFSWPSAEPRLPMLVEWRTLRSGSALALLRSIRDRLWP